VSEDVDKLATSMLRGVNALIRWAKAKKMLMTSPAHSTIS